MTIQSIFNCERWMYYHVPSHDSERSCITRL